MRYPGELHIGARRAWSGTTARFSAVLAFLALTAAAVGAGEIHIRDPIVKPTDYKNLAAITNWNAIPNNSVIVLHGSDSSLLAPIPVGNKNLTFTSADGGSVIITPSDPKTMTGAVFETAGGTVTLERVIVNKGVGGIGGNIVNTGAGQVIKGAYVVQNGTVEAAAPAGGRGAGIHSTHALTLGDGGVIQDNTADAVDQANAGQGGGVFSQGALTVGANNSFLRNSATATGTGGNDTALGGAVHIAGTSASTFGSGNTFSNNSAIAPGGDRSGRGGAVYSLGQLNFGNSTNVSGNVAESGGASAVAYGGGIYSNTGVKIGDNSALTSNTAEATAAFGAANSARGGAVYTAGTAAIGSGATITNNYALAEGDASSSAHGGAVYARTITLGDKAAVGGNEARGGTGSSLGYGGALYAAQDVTFGAGATVSGNTASAVGGAGSAQGGAVYAGRDVTVGAGGKFSENVAKISGTGASVNSGLGGAVYAGRDAAFGSSVTVDRNTVQARGDNSAIGGGVYAANGVEFKTKAVVMNNQALAASGGNAGLGGGVYAGGATGGNLKLGAEAAVTGNLARNNAGANGGHGGGLYAVNAVDVGANANIAKNTASGGVSGTPSGVGYGGGVYAGTGATFRDGSALADNQALGGTGTNSGYGGGVYVDQGTATFGKEVRVVNNTASGKGAGSARGGGVMSARGTAVFGDAATVSGNAAQSGGGANGALGGGVYAATGATFGADAVVSQNRAESSSGNNSARGGGVYVDTGTFAAGTDAVFSNNTARGAGAGSAQGGAVYTGGNATFASGAQLSGNIAQANGGGTGSGLGGAVYAANSVAFAENAEISGNQARGAGTNSGLGGGVYARDNLTLGAGAALANNTATGGGGHGGGAWVGGDATIYGGARVTGNRADGQGGGLYVNAGDVNLNALAGDIVFQGNYADGKANAVYMNNATGTSQLVSTANADRTVDFRDPIAGRADAVYIRGAGTTRFSEHRSNITADTVVESGATLWLDNQAEYGAGNTVGTFTVQNDATLKLDVDLAGDNVSANGHAVVHAGTITADSGSILSLSGSAPSGSQGQVLVFENVLDSANLDIAKGALEIDNKLLRAYFDGGDLVVRSRNMSDVYRDIPGLADIWRLNPNLTDDMREYLNNFYNNNVDPGAEFTDFLRQLRGSPVMNALYAHRAHLDDMRQAIRWRTSDFHVMTLEPEFLDDFLASNYALAAGPLESPSRPCGRTACVPNICSDPCRNKDMSGAFWATATQHWASQKNHGNALGYKYDPQAVALGYDRRHGENLMFGGAAQYAWGDMKSNDSDRTVNEVDNLLLAAYASYAMPKWYADANVVGGWGWNKTRTDYTLWDLSSRGKYDSYTLGLGAELGYIFSFDDGCGDYPLFVTPHAGVNFSYLHADAFRETGSAALTRRFDNHDWTQTEVPVGVKLSKSFQSGAIRWTPEIDFTYAYQFGRSAPQGHAEFVAMPGLDWSVAGVDAGSHIGRMNAGVRATIYERWELMASYDLEVRRRYYDHRVRGGLAVGF